MMSFIAKSSIWHDEGYSLLLAPQPVEQIIERTARDVHPPLYYLVLHGWVGLFGQSELAARSLSVVAVLAAMIVVFLIMRRLFGSGAARASALLLALAPFLIRYGQEARMYALVALLLTLATYLLITALDTGSRRRLYLYALVMVAAFYTHYYTVFMVVVHWLYVLIRTRWKKPRDRRTIDLKSWHWWGANGLIGLLFAPWLPAAYGQFSRVQAGFWIGEPDLYTLPNTIGQYLRFTSLPAVHPWLRLSIAGLIFVLIIWAVFKDRLNRRSLLLIGGWAFLGPLAVLLISLAGRPVYVDRYFVFAALAFYPLLAAAVYSRPLNRWRSLRWVTITGLALVLVSGINQVYKQSNHRMREIGQIVSARANSADRLIAGELYVYLDFSYYNRSGQPLYLYAPSGISGYGETSLLYDRPELVVRDYQALGRATTVWVIGKAGEKDYFKQVPTSWHLLEAYQAGESVARRYQPATTELVIR